MQSPHQRCAQDTPTRGLVHVLVVLTALEIAGCLAPRRVEPLGDAVRLFNDAVRWERFEMAATRVTPTKRDDFLDERDRLSEDLRISGYEVVRVRRDKTGRRAKVHLKYTWHLDSRGVVHTTHTVQRWERSGSSWILLAEDLLRGEPMPGVADPDEPLDEPEDEPGATDSTEDDSESKPLDTDEWPDVDRVESSDEPK